MRTGPFSNARVAKYLNEYFVPVYVSVEDFLAGKKGPDEAKLLRSIFEETKNKQLPQGNVHVYLLKPNAEVINSMHVRYSANIKTLMHMLVDASRDFGTEPGETLIRPKSQFTAPTVSADELLLHASLDYASRSRLAVGDWIVLPREDWNEFVPSPDLLAGEEWPIKDELARRILVHLYPYAADWDMSPDQISHSELTAYIIDQDGDKTTVAIRGHVRMVHNRQPGSDAQPLNAEVVGRVIVEPDRKPRILLATGNAVYAGRHYDGFVRSVNAPTCEASPDELRADEVSVPTVTE